MVARGILKKYGSKNKTPGANRRVKEFVRSFIFLCSKASTSRAVQMPVARSNYNNNNIIIISNYR